MHNPALGQESEKAGSNVYKDMAITRYDAETERGELIFYIKRWEGLTCQVLLKNKP